MEYFKNIYKARYILISLVIQDLKNKYRYSFLGVIWNFLSPLGLVVILGSVYSIVFNVPAVEFIPYLFSGLLPWIYFTSCADGGAFAFLSSQGYIKQTQVPIEIFPLRVSLVNLVNLLISILAFHLFYFCLSPGSYSWKMLLIVPALFIWFVFCSSWATISAFINLYLRDFQPFQFLIFQGVFYLSPIIYKAEMLRMHDYELIYLLNPFYYLLEIIRQPLLGKLPSLESWGISAIISIILFQISYYLMRNIGRKITFKL